MSAAAVAGMGWLGFRYQDRHAARLRSDAARAVAAPIRAELIHYHGEAIKVWRNIELTQRELERRNDPSQRFPYQYLPPAPTAMFESLRPRLGELGAFLAFEVVTVYATLPRGDRECWECTATEGLVFCRGRHRELSKIERMIDLLSALERSGATDGEYLTDDEYLSVEAGAHPVQLPDRIS